MKSIGSYEWRRDQVSAAVQAQAKANAPIGEKSVDIYVAETYEGFVIVRDYAQNKWWKVAYTITDKGEVTLGETSEVAQTWSDVSKAVRMLVPVQKDDATPAMRQITYIVVAEPSSETVLKADLQGDCYKPEDIELMAHGFMEKSQRSGEMHKSLVPGAAIVESFIAPVDYVVKTAEGEETVLKGSWVIGQKWPDEQWAKILKGDYTGVSIGGTGHRTPITNGTGEQVSGVSKAAGASAEPVALSWLFGVDVDEISVVDKGANGKKFLILKTAAPVEKTIKHEGEKWVLYSKDGTKKLGSYDTEKEATDRLAEIEGFKEEKVAKSTLVGWLIQTLRKTAGNSGPTTEVEDMTADEIKKAIAEGAAEALAPFDERIKALEAREPAPATEGEPAPAPVAKKEGEDTAPAAPSAEDIQKMVSAGVAEALKPLDERIQKLEDVQGERQSGADDEGAHKVQKKAGFWEGSGLII